MDDFESFSHGLISSKLWLCEELEKVIVDRNSETNVVHILGCWTNILAFMLNVRHAKLYTQIFGYDICKESLNIAKRINDCWIHQSPLVHNIEQDANTLTYDLHHSNLVIVNTSTEHFTSDKWFNNIPNKSIVCLQSSDVEISDPPWNIIKPNRSLNNFKERFKLSIEFFSGEKIIDYGDELKFKRFMYIGLK